MFGRGKDKLEETGEQAVAEVLEAKRSAWAMTQGNEAIVGNTTIHWKLRLQVKPKDQPPFEASLDHNFSQLTTPRPGMSVMVWFDPSDHSRVKIDDSNAAQTEAALQGVLGHNPALAGMSVGGQSVEQLMHAALADPAGFREQMQRQAAEANAAAAAAAAAYAPGGMPMPVGMPMPGGYPLGGYGAPVAGADPVEPAAATTGAPTAPAGPSAAPAAGDRIEQLERLAGLHERGVLNDEEFAAEKRRILGG